MQRSGILSMLIRKVSTRKQYFQKCFLILMFHWDFISSWIFETFCVQLSSTITRVTVSEYLSAHLNAFLFYGSDEPRSITQKGTTLAAAFQSEINFNSYDFVQSFFLVVLHRLSLSLDNFSPTSRRYKVSGMLHESPKVIRASTSENSDYYPSKFHNYGNSLSLFHQYLDYNFLLGSKSKYSGS